MKQYHLILQIGFSILCFTGCNSEASKGPESIASSQTEHSPSGKDEEKSEGSQEEQSNSEHINSERKPALPEKVENKSDESEKPGLPIYPPEKPDPIRLPSAEGKITIDLISPQNCIQRYRRLTKCDFGRIIVPGKENILREASLKSRFRTLSSGNCSTPFPIQLKVSRLADQNSRESDQVLSSTITALRNEESTIRRINRGSLGEIEIVDAFPKWTEIGSFDLTCRTSLEIEIDLPDSEVD